MFSFRERKKALDFQPYVRQLCDLTAPNLPRAEGELERTENRYNRSVPTILGPWQDERPIMDECLIAITSDMSDHGFGLLLTQPFRAEKLVVGYWTSRKRMPRPWFFVGDLRRNRYIGGGFWKIGIQLTEFANTNHWAKLAELEPLAEKLLPPAVEPVLIAT